MNDEKTLLAMDAACRPGWRIGSILVSVLISVIVVLVTVGMVWLPETLLSGEYPREFEWHLDGLLILAYLWGCGIAVSIILLLNSYRATRYEVHTGGIRIHLRTKRVVTIGFDQIEETYFRDTELLASRNFWQKFFDPIGSIRPDKKQAVIQWLFPNLHKDTWMPLHLGLAAREGEIYLRKRTGIKFSRIYLPWWNNPWYARELSLTPERPKEFFDELLRAMDRYHAVEVTG